MILRCDDDHNTINVVNQMKMIQNSECNQKPKGGSMVLGVA
jgi:hypothetical protein